MTHRMVIPSLPGTAAATARAPGVDAITIAFGVAKSRDDAPTHADFRPTYHVQIPPFSLGGLDPDGVYEFDAGGLLQMLVQRATRRTWGVRLELTLSQSQAEVAAGEIRVTSPDGASGPMKVMGSPLGTTTSGGGRSIVLSTPLVTDPGDIDQLNGAYVIEVGDAPPRRVQVHLGRFEFEG
jgi:hypothetical protein